VKVYGSVNVSREWAERTGTAYFLQVKGDCMAGAGIRDGDIVGVRPQGMASDGDIVLADVSGHRIVKLLRRCGDRDWLVAADPAYDPIPADDATILGVVGGAIHFFG
jgi:repressor LexA